MIVQIQFRSLVLKSKPQTYFSREQKFDKAMSSIEITSLFVSHLMVIGRFLRKTSSQAGPGFTFGLCVRYLKWVPECITIVVAAHCQIRYAT